MIRVTDPLLSLFSTFLIFSIIEALKMKNFSKFGSFLTFLTLLRGSWGPLTYAHERVDIHACNWVRTSGRDSQQRIHH